MRKRIISSLCAAAVMVFASVSWGSSFYIENTAQDIYVSGVAGLNVNVLAASGTVSIVSARDSGTLIDPALAIGETYDSGSVMMQVNSSITPDLMSVGSAAETPMITANGFLGWTAPATGDWQSVVTYSGFFQVLTPGVTASGLFNHTWVGDVSSGGSTYRDMWQIVDLITGNIVQSGDSGLISFSTLENGGQNSISFTSNGLNTGLYELFITAEANASVPEPSTFILAGSGLLGLVALRRRNRKQA